MLGRIGKCPQARAVAASDFFIDLFETALADDELLVRVGACGICGSDVHGYDGSTGRRQPPVIMGHEAAGVVEQIGSAVNGVGRSAQC